MMLVGVDEFEQVNIALSRFGNFGLKRFTLLKQYNKKFSALFTEMGHRGKFKFKLCLVEFVAIVEMIMAHFGASMGEIGMRSVFLQTLCLH